MASKGRISVQAVLVVVLWLGSTALAAGQAPVYLPLVTRGGEAEQASAEPTPVILQDEPPQDKPDEAVAPDSRAQDGDSADGLAADTPVAPEAFNAAQWTVQNNLGIGTESPAYRIDIAHTANSAARVQVRNTSGGSNAAAELYLTTGTSRGLLVKKFGSGATTTWDGIGMANYARLRTDTDARGLILTTGSSSYPVILGTADRERLRITSDGRVGIGIRSPNTAMRVHVDGGDLLRGLYVTNAVGAGVVVDDSGGHGVEINSPAYYGLYVNNPGIYGVRVGNSGTDGVYVYNPGTAGLRVDGTGDSNPNQNGVYVYDVGKDGVFVESPGSAGVSVAGSSLDGLVVTSSGRYGIYVGNSQNDGIYIDGTADDGIQIIDTTGHGVNVSSPDQDGVNVFNPGLVGVRVEFYSNTGQDGVRVINGNIRVQNGSFIDDGVIVADYVFEPGYPLMPLDELRAYVQQEKRLPNLPDAEAIGASGLDLGEFQMKLLEKVEELTLYTLAQDETIAAQQEQLTAQQEQNMALPAQIEALRRQNAELAVRLAALEQKLGQE